MAQNLDARNDGRLKALQLRRHRNVLQHAVNAVADAKFIFERFEVNVRRAQFDGVLQHLVDEADDGGFVFRGRVEVGVLGVFVNDFKAFFLVERADGVGADAEALFHFALDGFAGGEHRLEVQAGQGFQRVESLRGEQPAGGDFHGAVDALEREQFLLQQNARGEQREQLAIRLDVVQRGVSQAVFLGQPAQDVLLGFADNADFWRSNSSASATESCRAVTILSNNGFSSGSGETVALIR